jgi:hypothetical protein
MRAFLVCLTLAGALVACGNPDDVTSGAKQTLDRNQALWAQRTFGSYEYDLSLQDEAFVSNVQITVSGTTVVRVVKFASDEPPNDGYAYPTIDDLFATAQAAFGQKNTTLQMDFNQPYGFPTTLVVTRNSAVGPYSAHVVRFAPMP